MPGGRKYKALPRQLSDGDKTFIKLIQAGVNKTLAFKQAYPEHKSVMRYVDAVKDGEDKKVRARLALLVTQAAKTKTQTNYIQSAVVTYQKKLDYLAEKGLDVIEELLENGRSEKVRADLAIEMNRHKVGSPTQKVAVKEEKTVIITFGEPVPERTQIIEGEVIDAAST